MIEAMITAAMSIFCTETKPPRSLELDGAARQVEIARDHHFRIAAEHDLAQPDEEIGEPEGRHEQDDFRLVDQRPQHQALDAERQT